MRLGAVLGPSWGHLGAVLGPSWGHLGAVLGASLAVLGRLEASWGRLGRLELDFHKIPSRIPFFLYLYVILHGFHNTSKTGKGNLVLQK